jgi:hypothetical protein
MTTRTPADVLREARRRDSQEKRARALAMIERMLQENEPITFAAVAKAANVSTWLVYAPGVREHLDQARRQQADQPSRATARGQSASPASLRTDLEFARAEIKRLRTELDTTRDALRRQIGQQLEGPDATALQQRAHELTVENQALRSDMDRARSAHDALAAKLAETEEDLIAARLGLRRMMRTNS